MENRSLAHAPLGPGPALRRQHVHSVELLAGSTSVLLLWPLESAFGAGQLLMVGNVHPWPVEPSVPAAAPTPKVEDLRVKRGRCSPQALRVGGSSLELAATALLTSWL